MLHRRMRLALITLVVAGGVLCVMSVWAMRRWLLRTPAQFADDVFGACIFGDTKACAQVIPAHVASCEDGYVEHCHQAGGFLLGGSLSTPDPAEALRLLHRGCSLGQARCCYDAGHMLDKSRVGRHDPAGALEAYRAACSLRHREGCHRAGLMLARDTKNPKRLREAEALLGVACANGSQLGCYNYMVIRCRVDKNTEFARHAILRMCEIESLRCDASRFDLREPSADPNSNGTIWPEICAACR